MRLVGKIFIVVYEVVAALLVVSAAAVLALLLFGIRPYVVLTGSMEPAIPQGSICLVNSRSSFAEVSAGDVIAFRMGRGLRRRQEAHEFAGDQHGVFHFVLRGAGMDVYPVYRYLYGGGVEVVRRRKAEVGRLHYRRTVAARPLHPEIRTPRRGVCRIGKAGHRSN